MRNRFVAVLLFVVFILEGTIVNWLLAFYSGHQISIAPHLVLVIVLMVAMQRNRHIGLAFGLVFGFIHDIVYASPMIGPHAFAMALAAYGAGVAAGRIKLNMAMTFFIISLSIVIHDLMVFSLYRMFRVTAMAYAEMITELLTPAILFNLLFAVIIYVPVRKMLEMKTDKREEEG